MDQYQTFLGYGIKEIYRTGREVFGKILSDEISDKREKFEALLKQEIDTHREINAVKKEIANLLEDML